MKKTKWERIIRILFMLYLVFFVRIILFKDAPWNHLTSVIGTVKREISLIPFFGTISMAVSGKASLLVLMKNIAGNIFIFIPFGMVLPALTGRKKIKQILTFGLGISVLVESIQFLFGMGVSDVDDVLLNAAGTAAGFFLYRWLGTNRRLTVCFVLYGLMGAAILLNMDSSLLFSLEREQTVVNGELVSGLALDRPDVSGKFISFTAESGTLRMQLSRESASEKIRTRDWQITESTEIYLEYDSSESRFGQTVKEQTEYQSCDLLEFTGRSVAFSIENNVLIWSRDGEQVDVLILIIWE